MSTTVTEPNPRIQVPPIPAGQPISMLVSGMESDADTSFYAPLKREWDIGRVSLHIAFWIFNGYSAHVAMDRVLRVDPALPPDPDLLTLMYFTHLGMTFILFYSYGYLIVPKLLISLVYSRSKKRMFLLTKNSAIVVIASLSLFIFFNVYDYYLFTYGYEHYQPSPSYVKRYYDLLQQKGPFGVVGSFSVMTFIWGYNLSYILFPLLLRIIRESINWGVETANQKRLNQHLMETQIQMLKFQINPHFLFNVFNNMYALVQRTNEKAAGLILRLSELMRYTIRETDQSFVPLERELTFMRNYVDIEKSRHFETDSIQFSYTGNTDKYLVPPLLIVTFIENAFKHGINNTVEDGWVKINLSIDEQNQLLHTSVINYVDSNPTPVNQKGGLGLVNARNRLDLLFGSGAYQLTIKSTQNEYSVRLSIPLKKSLP